MAASNLSFWQKLGLIFMGAPATPSSVQEFEGLATVESFDYENRSLFGPFPCRDVSRISDYLDKRQIQFEMLVDPDMYRSEKERLIDEAKPYDYAFGHTFSPAFVFFALSNKDLGQIDTELENLGFVTYDAEESVIS